MKILTLNFLTCAVKACKSSPLSFPLHPKECTLVTAELPPNPVLLTNILPRIDWPALIIISKALGFTTLRPEAPTKEELEGDEGLQKELWGLLVETQIEEGGLVCGNCSHEYKIREGIANFLLPGHLV